MIDVIVLRPDAQGALDALHDAARLARDGAPFDVALQLPDNRALIAGAVARDILAGTPDRAARLAQIDALAAVDARVNGRLLEELSPIPDRLRATMGDLVLLARYVRVASWSQARRLTLGLGLPIRRALECTADTAVPQPPAERSSPGTRTVLWAPQLTTADVLIALVAAAEDGAPVDVICSGGPDFGYDVRIVAPADAADTLAHAAVIVVCDTDFPAAAVALSAWQRPLCAPSTSGAAQWLRGLTTYRPWSRPDCSFAIAAARALPAPQVTIFPQTPAYPYLAPSEEGPAVRVIVRAEAARPCALTTTALQRQRYAPIEIVVAQSDADAERAATDTNAAYIMHCDDGDAPFPHAIAQFVAALERSGADTARGDALVTYLIEAPGEPVAIGHATIGEHTWAVNTLVDMPLRTMHRRVPQGVCPAVDIDAVAGAVYRYVDGRLPARGSAAPRVTREPALRLQPPRPL